ncbi:hypothetical protein CVT26_005197, partial [Gymnopilus dilepis]
VNLATRGLGQSARSTTGVEDSPLRQTYLTPLHLSGGKPPGPRVSIYGIRTRVILSPTRGGNGPPVATVFTTRPQRPVKCHLQCSVCGVSKLRQARIAASTAPSPNSPDLGPSDLTLGPYSRATATLRSRVLPSAITQISRRARFPELPPPLGPRTPSPDGPALVTKSPHTNRTVKKGKVSDKLTQKSSARAPSHQSVNSQLPATASTSTEPRTQPTERPDHASAAQAILKALTSQAQAALRTIETLTNTHPDLAQLDVDRTRQHTTSKFTTIPKHSPPRNVGFVRIIFDFQGKFAQQPRPVKLRDFLNQKFQVIDVKFAAAEFSAAGTLILPVTSTNARQLQIEHGFVHVIRQHVTDVADVLDEDDITAYPDKPWHRVVINRISLEDARKAAKSTDSEEMLLPLWEELKGLQPTYLSALCRHYSP